ncbi:hypothetical protein [Vibrio alginolyticus]|uniref:hypothetical protein n=1 Tax=Vibrio alginolyticus TaxID=663 RepID=UPI003D0B87F6
MSKIKHPVEKKKKSYANDCRNSYGENDKSSRKNIRRGKQLSSKSLRSSITEILSIRSIEIDEELANELDMKVRVSEKVKRRKAFKKQPDSPLGEFLEIKESVRKRT